MIWRRFDGVKNGYGKAVLPIHLIKNENSLEILEPKKILRVSVYLQYFVQPFYRRVHADFLDDVRNFFHATLRQEK